MKINNPNFIREQKLREQRWIDYLEYNLKNPEDFGCDEEGMFNFLKSYIEKNKL